jgi:DNA-binding Lrp family transcriptional regulator
MMQNSSISSIEILKRLNSKSKINFSNISGELGITRLTLQNRITNLREKKIISNYTININPNLRPNLKYVFMEIKTNPKEPFLVKELFEIPQLRTLDGILGEFSLIAMFVFNDLEDFNRNLNKIDYVMADSYFKKYQFIETIKVYKINSFCLNNQVLNMRDLDEKDFLILEILQRYQKSKLLSTYEIKRIFKKEFRIILSQSTIYKRIKDMEDRGIILNYTITFNPKLIGYKGKFYVKIKPKNPAKYDMIAENLEKSEFITDLFRIGEQYGLLAIVRVREIDDYGRFIKNIYDTEEIEDTFTNFALDELKPFTNFKLF